MPELKIIEWVQAGNIATLVMDELNKRHFYTENKEDAEGLREPLETIVANELMGIKETNLEEKLQAKNEPLVCGCEGLHHPDIDENHIIS
jgi:hypothetical protein